jgi:N-acetylmuramoyl-L-alanine amidase
MYKSLRWTQGLSTILWLGGALSTMSLEISAQESVKIRRHNIQLTTTGTSVDLGTKSTSLAIQASDATDLKDSYVVAGQDTFRLHHDVHLVEEKDKPSYLIVFNSPSRLVKIFTNQNVKNITLVSMYVPPVRLPLHSFRTSSNCAKPDVVPASLWRQGLTGPREAAVQTRVTHVVVHHAAGSNTNTDYTNVVRNIYVFHTQSNGWNDVGYNFLIAQDGTVFEGRNGQGAFDGDNALGAHFCGRNTNTMGICLLGDYMIAQPTEPALTSLVRLIGWKLGKESITAQGQSLHSPSGLTLNHIAGHRDGCATDCPGDNLYIRLGDIRTKVAAGCSDAPPIVLSQTADNGDILVFPNPAQDYLRWQSSQLSEQSRFVLYGLYGVEIPIQGKLQADAWELFLGDVPTGAYVLAEWRGGQLQEVRKVSVQK